MFYKNKSDSDIEDDEEKEALEIQKKNAVILEDNDFFDEDLRNIFIYLCYIYSFLFFRQTKF